LALGQINGEADRRIGGAVAFSDEHERDCLICHGVVPYRSSGRFRLAEWLFRPCDPGTVKLAIGALDRGPGNAVRGLFLAEIAGVSGKRRVEGGEKYLLDVLGKV
jgi:hypothetical protein